MLCSSAVPNAIKIVDRTTNNKIQRIIVLLLITLDIAAADSENDLLLMCSMFVCESYDDVSPLYNLSRTKEKKSMYSFRFSLLLTEVCLLEIQINEKKT